MGTQQGSTSQSIAAQSAELNPSDFKGWITKRLHAVEAIVDTVVETVEQNNLEPVAGARIAACVAGSVFGYEEFHPRAGSMPAEQMIDAEFLGTLTKGRELAGSR